MWFTLYPCITNCEVTSCLVPTSYGTDMEVAPPPALSGALAISSSLHHSALSFRLSSYHVIKGL